MNPAVFKAVIILAYVAAYGHTPPTQAEIDAWAVKVNSDGSNLDMIVAQVVNTAEGVLHMAQAKAVLDAVHAQAVATRELAIAFPS